MTTQDLYGNFREVIGSPDPNRITNQRLSTYLVTALEQFAAEMNYLIKEDSDFFLLAADQAEYPLPDEVLSIMWVSWNDLLLDPASTELWDRDGTTWRGATSGDIPQEYAIEGRRLILNPPPTATAITTDPSLTVRYVACQTSIDAAGLPFLSDLDQWLIIYQAAILWCINHASEENALRLQGYQGWIDRQMPGAKRRHENPIKDFEPGFRPQIDRLGAAR